MTKNEVVELEITDVTSEGSGIGRYNGMAIFVPNTAVGDKIKAKIVKVKKNYAFGIAEEVISPSFDRVSVDCPYFSKCGGCVFRHINYNKELEIKRNRVHETLKRIAGIEIKGGEIYRSISEKSYRNKAQFPFTEGLGAGFFAPRSHRVVPIKNCPLLPEEFNQISKCVSDFLKDNNISVYNEENGKGLVRHLYIRKGAVSGDIMVVIVINGDILPKSDILKDRLISVLGDNLKSFLININKKFTNVILGEKNKLIFGKTYITDTICGIKIRLSPFTFYQVNHDVAERLYHKVSEYAEPENKYIIDLYCGAGTIGLYL